MNDNVVVYRSLFERDADIFWHQHPEFLAGFLILLCIFVVIVVGAVVFDLARKFLKK